MGGRALLSLPQGFNWFLILVTVIVSLLVLAGCIYILVEYQHPEDRNQAWVPKIIVVLSMALAIWTVLMFPLDVGNTNACASNISPSACTYTLPMTQLWYAVFISNLVLVFLIIPFTLFFYEADSDYTFCQKVKGSLMWTAGFLIFIILIIVIMYREVAQLSGHWARARNKEKSLSSTPPDCLQPFLCVLWPLLSFVPPQCSAFGSNFKFNNWKLRVSLPVYIMAIQSVLGWLLFLVFAGVGLLAAPIDWLQEFLGRPKATITKSEYMRRAMIIAQRAKQILNMLQLLRRGERDRRWRSNFQKLQREVALLEDDEYQLERVFPQGEDGEVRWVLFMIGFYLLGFMSFVGFCLTGIWVAHIIAYMLPPIPLHPFLNIMFVVLDDVFPLFGTAAFALFCLYLMSVAMKGNFILGLNFLIIKLYPMRPGATMMSSFLVNTALILVMAPAIVQFCAQAFAVYADGTSIFDVFGNQVMYLIGIKYIYNFNIFLYGMLSVMVLSGIFLAFRGKKVWKRRNPLEAYAVVD
ncbi:hypothetical protein VOLCADRAFT_67279 [Volvox carteri f. nagariensis]|uniref:LMBR1-like membrane protein n=1 Tax=Volvox carteri f. nagariensis TaxID=3068 RepID=D8UDB0_VOLCA|nr:uncharacterized protein VOLCADRAFT_67279 [Volvox carteri f. nagariensis]EFJ42278.1 hypothetical protein VOLCADRAFT_67279 [Volvox carteri f. nagariensis]|eukprot:XP_002956676.1 hypothetical protein VOLCADRAFT_67279 [Volvox carteri f. nagariensis]